MTKDSLGKSGKIDFEIRKDSLDEINKYVELIDDLKKTGDISKFASNALDEVRHRIESLKYTSISASEVIKKIKSYSRVPLGDGKFLHLSSYAKASKGAKQVATKEKYVLEVHRMIDNTKSNLANLMMFKEDDKKLRNFVSDCEKFKEFTQYDETKAKMEELTKSGMLEHYNSIKMEFLKSWLAPFESKLSIKVEDMSQADIKNALTKVEGLKKKELEELGVVLSNDRLDDFRGANKVMDESLNGENIEFWGSEEYRDEFIELIKKVINKFSFKLENHFLIFKLDDESICYLLGFPDDIYKKIVQDTSATKAFVPHLKVFFQNPNGGYMVLEKNDAENPKEYFELLKKVWCLFLSSMSTSVESPLSEGFQDAFEMWL